MAFEDTDWLEDADPPVQPLTQQEAQALAARHPSMTVWQVIAAQAVFGVLVALVWGVLSRSSVSAVSALYGCAVAVMPSALMARGVFGRHAAGGVGGLLLWEILKLCLIGCHAGDAGVVLEGYWGGSAHVAGPQEKFCLTRVADV